MADIKKWFLVLISCLTFILFSASCIGDIWVKTDGERFQRFAIAGLWRWCNYRGKCFDYPDRLLPVLVYTLRVMAVLSVLTSNVACVLAVVHLLSEKMKGYYSSIFLILATVCMMITLAIFVNHTKKSFGITTFYGWSFNVGLIGCFSGIAGIVLGF